MNTTKLIIPIVLASLMGFGCSKLSSQGKGAGNTTVQPPIPVDPNPPVGTGSGTGSGSPYSPFYSGGATVQFTPVSLEVMNEYVATHPLNNPSNFQININVAQSEAARYGGTVRIGYTDSGMTYSGDFKAGMGRNQSNKGMYDNNTLQAQYNYWFKYQGKTVFSGFFEDNYGAVVLVLEPETATNPGNDAEPFSVTYKGSIYFKNFGVTTSPYINDTTRSCWFTYKGPADCRSNIVMTKCALQPGTEAGYKLLGTFTGVDVKKAFNIK